MSRRTTRRLRDGRASRSQDDSFPFKARVRNHDASNRVAFRATSTTAISPSVACVGAMFKTISLSTLLVLKILHCFIYIYDREGVLYIYVFFYFRRDIRTLDFRIKIIYHLIVHLSISYITLIFYDTIKCTSKKFRDLRESKQIFKYPRRRVRSRDLRGFR